MPERALPLALAAVMLGVAVFCAVRLVLGTAWHRRASHDIDLVHVAMGVSMAGMLTGWLTGRWTDLWLVAFSLSTAWFAWRAVRELADDRPASPGCGHLPHLVGSAAMLYMLISMQWAPMSANGTSMAASSNGMGSLTLPLLVSALLVLNALLSAGQVLFFSPRATAMPGIAGSGASVSAQRWRPERHDESERGVIAPRCGVLCLVAMSAAMAYMFLTVRP